MQQPTTFRIFGTPRGRFVRLSKPTASSVNTFRPTGGFTLIELLVVISIIAILAALVLSAAGFVQKKGARDRASAEIAALGAALESFKADNGDYPSNSAPGSSAALVTNLMPSSAGRSILSLNLNLLTRVDIMILLATLIIISTQTAPPITGVTIMISGPQREARRRAIPGSRIGRRLSVKSPLS